MSHTSLQREKDNGKAQEQFFVAHISLFFHMCLKIIVTAVILHFCKKVHVLDLSII